MLCPSCRGENDEAAEVCFHCRAVLLAVTRGTIIGGRYEVLSSIGRGGMGEVYRARDRVLEEEVALKVLRAEAAGAGDWARRFRSEIRLARKVTHPNVCRIHDYGEEGSLRWLSMELVAGENLKQALARRGPFPAAEARDVALQAAEGLAAIHAAGIVHRDLKALNLMVDATGRVRVMDFGIARPAAEGTTEGGESGYVIGSPEYMSPEKARGRPSEPRSDLYSLGVVLYELLTGVVPFRAETPVAILLQHLEAEPPLDHPAVTPELRPVLARCLAKDPADRFASARVLADALGAPRGGGSGVPVSRRAPSRGVMALAAAVLAVAAGAALLTRSPDPASAPPKPGSSRPSPPSVPPPSATPRLSPETPPPASPAEVSPAPLSSQRRTERRTHVSVPPAPTPTPVPTEPTPASIPTAEPVVPTTLAAAPTPSPAEVADGGLLVLVTPWADVSIDGVPVGQTPLARIPLPPGPHAVLLTHPDYEPLPRRVTIDSGETFRLVVDLPSEGVRRPP